MENNRRSFFKSIATFASGVVAVKVAQYAPKKEEQLLVTNQITVRDEHGKEYYPVVVAKTKADETEIVDKVADYGSIKFHSSAPKEQIRKLNV
jgi:hypothetical protein